MLRQKFYSAALLIYCSLLTIGSAHQPARGFLKNIIANTAVVEQPSMTVLCGFEVQPSGVQFAEEYLKKNDRSLIKLKKRGQSKLTTITAVFNKYNIPAVLKYMAMVESNLNTDTVCNSTGATGMWQLMPETACELGLEISATVDERLQVYKSSVAVAKYLRQLHAEFGDWLLVVAAYNAGPTKVTRAINSSGHHNFWQLQNFLPTETRNHVKKFVSLLYLFEGQNEVPIQQDPQL